MNDRVCRVYFFLDVCIKDELYVRYDVCVRSQTQEKNFFFLLITLLLVQYLSLSFCFFFSLLFSSPLSFPLLSLCKCFESFRRSDLWSKILLSSLLLLSPNWRNKENKNEKTSPDKAIICWRRRWCNRFACVQINTSRAIRQKKRKKKNYYYLF